MKFTIKKGFLFLAVFLQLVVAALFVTATYASRLHPGDWWFTGFLGLFFPFLMLSMFVLLIFWIFINRWGVFFSLGVLLLCLPAIRVHLPFNLPAAFQQQRDSSAIRLMSWNLRHFIPFNESGFKPDRIHQQKEMVQQIRQYQPDVICMQEFISMPYEGDEDPRHILVKELGYKYHQFAGHDIFGTDQYSGIAIFSRYPIIDGNVLPLPASDPDDSEEPVYADVVIRGDTLRVYSIHLKSFGFGSKEYKALDDVEAKGDDRRVFRKMRSTFLWHGLQADHFRDEVDASPHPVVIAGDFNDVPASYAYSVIKGNRTDAFLEKGAGLGATFNSSSSAVLQMLPTLRIDYILHSPEMYTMQFTRGGKWLSDHSFIVADISLP